MENRLFGSPAERAAWEAGDERRRATRTGLRSGAAAEAQETPGGGRLGDEDELSLPRQRRRGQLYPSDGEADEESEELLSTRLRRRRADGVRRRKRSEMMPAVAAAGVSGEPASPRQAGAESGGTPTSPPEKRAHLE